MMLDLGKRFASLTKLNTCSTHVPSLVVLQRQYFEIIFGSEDVALAMVVPILTGARSSINWVCINHGHQWLRTCDFVSEFKKPDTHFLSAIPSTIVRHNELHLTKWGLADWNKNHDMVQDALGSAPYL